MENSKAGLKMPVELQYQPLKDPDEVTKKLRDLAQEYNPVSGVIEKLQPIPDRVLFEGVFDILASRGGEKWKEELELLLNPSPETELEIFGEESTEDHPSYLAYITVKPVGGSFEQREEFMIPEDEPKLYSVDKDTDTETPIPEGDNAVRIRLLQLLLDGQTYF